MITSLLSHTRNAKWHSSKSTTCINSIGGSADSIATNKYSHQLCSPARLSQWAILAQPTSDCKTECVEREPEIPLVNAFTCSCCCRASHTQTRGEREGKEEPGNEIPPSVNLKNSTSAVTSWYKTLREENMCVWVQSSLDGKSRPELL